MRIHTILQDMLAAYDNGEADDQRKEFIAGWAATIAPPDAKAEEHEVLVRGNPVDGFTMAGPFPEGFHEDRAIPEEAWVVLLESPS
jgi:hypothetical protein